VTGSLLRADCPYVLTLPRRSGALCKWKSGPPRNLSSALKELINRLRGEVSSAHASHYYCNLPDCVARRTSERDRCSIKRAHLAGRYCALHKESLTESMGQVVYRTSRSQERRREDASKLRTSLHRTDVSRERGYAALLPIGDLKKVILGSSPSKRLTHATAEEGSRVIVCVHPLWCTAHRHNCRRVCWDCDNNWQFGDADRWPPTCRAACRPSSVDVPCGRLHEERRSPRNTTNNPSNLVRQRPRRTGRVGPTVKIRHSSSRGPPRDWG
jgi:hypothetical protein